MAFSERVTERLSEEAAGACSCGLGSRTRILEEKL